VSGHANDQFSRTPFFDQCRYRSMVNTTFPVCDHAQRACGTGYVLTNGNTNAA
jgi:hypothetical protein